MPTRSTKRATIACLALPLLLRGSTAHADQPAASDNSRSTKNALNCRCPELGNIAVDKVQAAIASLTVASPSPDADGASNLNSANRLIEQARKAIVLDCAAPLSNELCWTAKPDAKLADAVRRAISELDNAARAVTDLPDSVDADVKRSLESRIELLRAFADIFTAIASFDDSSAGRDRLIDACINVSVYLDDKSPGVAESAKLWQGVAYRKAGRPDRTLQLLWPAIGNISSNRVDFYARIERCRALLERGQHVSALALAVKLNERLDEWMKNESEETKSQARDTLIWVRVAIHRDWAESLRKNGETARAKTADEAAEKLLGEHPFPAPPGRWLRLSESIAGLPEWTPTKASSATSQPDAKKSS